MDMDNVGDPFDNGGMWLVFAMLALLGLLTFVGLGAIYYGDSVASPSWGERSTPPPTLAIALA